MSELREAAERLRDFFVCRNGERCLGTDHCSDETYCDIATVVRAYLSEHKPDDDEPISAEWLRKHFNVNEYRLQWSEDNVLCVNIPLSDSRVTLRRYEANDEWALWRGDDGIPWNIKTRRDVRNLCKALGVEIQEVPTVEGRVVE